MPKHRFFTMRQSYTCWNQLLFKWIKQNIVVKTLWGFSENAVKIHLCKMSLDDAFNLRQLGMKLIILLLMRQPCARRCRCLLPVGNLDLKHGRNKHINLAGMDAYKEGRGVLLQILGADMKRGQFLRWAKRLRRWFRRGWFCHIFDIINFRMVAFTVIHNQPLWFCKYNNPNRNLSSWVTTQVTTFFWLYLKIGTIHQSPYCTIIQYFV